MLSSNDYKKLLDFQSQICSYNDDFRQTVLKAMIDLYQEYSMAFFLTDENEQYINPVSVNIDADIMKSYEKYYFKTDIFHTFSIPKKLLAKDIVHITDIMSINNFEKTEFYNDLLKKMGVYDEIALQLRYQGKLIGVVGIMKPKVLGDFTEKEVQCAAILQKNISHMLGNSLAKLKYQHQNNLIMSFVNEAPIGMVVLDSKLDVIQYNQMSVRLISDILEKDCENNFNESFARMLSDKLYFREISYNTTSIETCINNHFVRIVPFIVPDFIHGIKTFYATYIMKTDKIGMSDYDNLKTIYCLTDRECEIVSLLVQGFSNKKIADKLYLSQHTVKTHLQNIYKKMNCISRTEVIHKITNGQPNYPDVRL